MTGPPGVPVENIAIRMVGTEQYTTSDAEGNFYFYNLREGDYGLAVDEQTLPEFAVISKPDRVSLVVPVGQQPKLVDFQFEVHKPEKPVRKVLFGTRD